MSALRCLSFLGKEVFTPGKMSLGSLNRTSSVAAVTVMTARQFSLSSQNYLKEIVVKETDKLTTFSGQYIESPFISNLIKLEDKGDNPACPLCVLNLNIKHTDVLILSQFLRKDGCLLPRRITGLCSKQQRRIRFLVAMSQKSGLMPNLSPKNSKKDPSKRRGSKKYNRFFDESTLDYIV